MYINENYRKIANVDISDLKQLVSLISSKQWCQFSQRQGTYAVHASTQTIPLIFDSDFRHKFPTHHAALAQFETALIPVLQAITDYFDGQDIITRGGQKAQRKSYFVRVILVKLNSNSHIAPHVDNGYSLARSHRIHLPILSNSEVEFSIDGQAKHMKEGELWEINNRKLHGVNNSSCSSRVHFIFDYVIKGEQINQPNCDIIYA